MLKKILPLALVPLAFLVPSVAKAGGTVTLSVNAATSVVSTLEETTIDFSYTCNNWISGGSVQLYIEGASPTNIGDPVTVPDISLTSFQLSGSVTYAFPAAGTYVVNARVTGTLDSVAGSSCDLGGVNSGTAITFTVTDATTTTVLNDGMPIAPTGIDATITMAVATSMLTVGVLLLARRRFF